MKAMNPPRVLGCVMARNEWPLLGVSIMHALSLGLKRVIVVDHDSHDATRENLEILRSTFGDRLIIHRLENSPFFQEAVIAAVLATVDADDFDWVYVFDADEFLLLDGGKSLSEILSAVPSTVASVRYQIHQWVAPSDMDAENLTELSRVERRAIPNHFLDLSVERTIEEIHKGNLTFFDLQFPSKVIVRHKWAHALTAGAHSTKVPGYLEELAMDDRVLRVGHVPLLSRKRLSLKCSHGQALIEAGFPSSHGWQSQMLRNLQVGDLLEHFWQRHSIPDFPDQFEALVMPTTIEDHSLRGALTLATDKLAQCKSLLHPKPNRLSSPESCEWSHELSPESVRAIHLQLLLRDELVAEKEVRLEELKREAVKLNVLTAERDAVIDAQHKMILQIERKRISAVQRLSRLESSRSWRIGLFITWPLRKLKRWVRVLS